MLPKSFLVMHLFVVGSVSIFISVFPSMSVFSDGLFEEKLLQLPLAIGSYLFSQRLIHQF